MATQPVTFENLRTQLRARRLAPVYLLHGAEGYFIDELVKDFESILDPADREFNQYILYAPQMAMEAVVDICRSIPMMGERQVVILKEAQGARADQLDKLARYILDPTPSTVLVVCSRGEEAKGKEMLAAMRKSSAVVFESRKVPDYQMGSHISSFINGRGLNVQPKALEMLREYIGTDLSRMYNEISKLIAILGPGATVTPEAVERHIGVSRDYNVFELVDALARRDGAKAMRIAAYFRSNPKAAPASIVAASVFAFFSDLLVTYFEKDKSDYSLMRALNYKSTWQLRRINDGRSRYNAYQVIEIIRAIRAFDGAVKGIGSRRDEHQLLDELVFRILTAPGTLFPRY